MVKMSVEKRLERIQQQKEKLKKEEQRIKKTVAAEERRKETRRKVLVGSMVLEKAKTDPEANQRLYKGLKVWLKREDEIALFPEMDEIIK